MSTLTMVRGDDESFDVTATTPRRNISGVLVTPLVYDPIDLTDIDLRWTAKNSIDDPDVEAVIAKTTGSGITALDPANGAARIDIDAADTDEMEGETVLQWDLQATDELGKVRTLALGQLKILRDVSRTTP